MRGSRGLGPLVIAALTGCATPTLQTSPNPRPFPTAAVPSVVAGLPTKLEPRGEIAFSKVGPDTGVQRGEVWTLSRGGVVVGAVQVAQLKNGLSTRKDVVRAGVRGSLPTDHYRWFKVAGTQWVGEQQAAGLRRYLWLPRSRDDLYVVLQLKSDVADPLSVIEGLVSAPGGLS